ALQGQYFFADFIDGKVFTLRFNGTAWVATDRTAQITTDAGAIHNPSSFGEDARGNLYLVDYGGAVFSSRPWGRPPTRGMSCARWRATTRSTLARETTRSTAVLAMTHCLAVRATTPLYLADCDRSIKSYGCRTARYAWPTTARGRRMGRIRSAGSSCFNLRTTPTRQLVLSPQIMSPRPASTTTACTSTNGRSSQARFPTPTSRATRRPSISSSTAALRPTAVTSGRLATSTIPRVSRSPWRPPTSTTSGFAAVRSPARRRCGCVPSTAL